MKIILDQDELEDVILNALCNGGLNALNSSGIELDFDKIQYAKHRVQHDCYEANLVSVLRGGDKLYFKDNESFNEDGEFSLADAKQRLEEGSDEYGENIINIQTGNDDETDGFNVLQLCIYGKVQFG